MSVTEIVFLHGFAIYERYTMEYLGNIQQVCEEYTSSVQVYINQVVEILSVIHVRGEPFCRCRKSDI